MIAVENFMIDMDLKDGIVAWKFLGKLNAEEAAESANAIKEAVMKMKQKHQHIKLLVDNWDMSKDGVRTAFHPKVAEVWGGLQQWFVSNLVEGDKTAVIQGGSIVKGQMSRMCEQSGLSKIEKHFYDTRSQSFEETKKQAYEYLGIKNNKLVDVR